MMRSESISYLVLYILVVTEFDKYNMSVVELIGVVACAGVCSCRPGTPGLHAFKTKTN